MVFTRNIIAAGLILLLLTACATDIHPDDVKAYRYFPEYDGFMPVELTERRRLYVHADWVLPAEDADDKPDLQLPSTAEQAKTIVTTRARKEQSRAATLVPVQVLAAPLILPAFLVVYPMHDMHMGKHRIEKNEAYVNFAGLKLNIRITDEKGRAVSGAQVHELSSKIPYHDYTDNRGKRSFAAPKVLYYDVPTRAVRLRARYLRVSLGRITYQVRPSYIRFGNVMYGTKRAQNNSTEIAYVSDHFMPYARYTEQGGWQWVQSPGPQTLHLVAWAPGFAPKLISIRGVQPKSTVTRSLKLTPLPNRRKMQRAAKQLNTLLDDLFQGKHEWVRGHWVLPDNKLAAINQ